MSGNGQKIECSRLRSGYSKPESPCSLPKRNCTCHSYSQSHLLDSLCASEPFFYLRGPTPKKGAGLPQRFRLYIVPTHSHLAVHVIVCRAHYGYTISHLSLVLVRSLDWAMETEEQEQGRDSREYERALRVFGGRMTSCSAAHVHFARS